MKRVNFQSLETLCRIARLGTFQAAAEQLHATQPSVSARIKELEVSLGITLFQRHGRRMILTSQGRELVEYVEPLLLKLEDALVAVENPASTTGIVRIGVGEIVALTWFPAMMAGLKNLMPNVSYQIEVDLTVRLRQRLESGEIDVAIIAAPIVLHQIDSAPLGAVRMRWMMSPRLKAAGTSSKAGAGELLRRNSLWTISKPSTIYPMAIEALKQFDVSSAHINTCDNNLCLIEMIANGAGIGLVPEILAEDLVRRGKLVSASSRLPRPELPFAIAWSKDRGQSIIRRIVDAAMQYTVFDRTPVRASAGPH